MALIETMLDGTTINKPEMAIKLLQMFEPKEGYYLAFSGGKDSCVIKHLMEKSGCKFDAHYNVTSVDPPEVMRFILDYHKDVKWEYPRDKTGKRVTMWTLIEKKRLPPTRTVRYCCQYLKEIGGGGRLVVTGVRRHESVNRYNNQGEVVVMNAPKGMDEFGRRTEKGGLILNYDNDDSRDIIQSCYRTSKTLVNPICEWTDADVWEYIKQENIPYCKLYDEGLSRIGCIACPLAGPYQMRKDAERWPEYKRLYIRAFDKMLEKRKMDGLKTDTWKTGEDVWNSWVLLKPLDKPIEGQITFDELMEGKEQ